MMKTVISFILFLCASSFMVAQSDYPWLRSGDQLTEKGRFDEAETSYRKAQELKAKPSTAYNLGNTIYQQNRLPEAITEYKKSISHPYQSG